MLSAVPNKAEVSSEKCDPGHAEVPAGILSVSQPEPSTNTAALRGDDEGAELQS